jgi:predicted CXXCH cytochrome family protein
MKRLRITNTIGALLAIGLIGLPVAALAGISGTNHDMSGAGWNSVNGEICQVCHTPHNADDTVLLAPLWNHTLGASTGFTMYNSGTMNAVDAESQPDGISLLCLSCHDGSVALDSFGGNVGSTSISGVADLGSDLSNDHPISITYNTALSTADDGLWDPSGAGSSGLGGTIDGDMLFSSKVQCASCHDPHSSAFNNFLIKDNAGSALCLTCHNK